jgi:hypothetical protein
MFPSLVVLFAVAVAFFTQQWLAWQAESTRDLIEGWARRHQLKLVRVERRWLQTGPFSVTQAVDLPTFRVVARKSDGSERAAWVRCGAWPWGVLDDTVEEHWTP